MSSVRPTSSLRAWLQTLRLRWLIAIWLLGVLALSLLGKWKTHGGGKWVQWFGIVPLSLVLVTLVGWWIALHLRRKTRGSEPTIR